MISQLTVFMENERGRLASACRTIADAGINMYALFVADTADFGVARIFCDTPQAAADALTAAGYRAGENVEYGYCFDANDGTAVDVLKVDGGEGIEGRLTEAGFQLVKPEEIYELDR